MKPIPTDPIKYAKAVEKIKHVVKVWPSAYASGLVVQEYKRQMKAKKQQPYKDNIPKTQRQTNLSRWYQEKWIDIKTGKPCGSVHTPDYYPTCRPSIRITSQTPVTSSELTRAEQLMMVKKKQVAQTHRVYFPSPKSKLI